MGAEQEKTYQDKGPMVFKKTRLMKIVEDRFAESGETIEGLIRKYSLDENMLDSEIASKLEISKDAAGDWRNIFGISPRSANEIGKIVWKRPGYKDRLSAKHKEIWKDEGKRVKFLSCLHNSSTNALRSKTLSTWHKNNPDKSGGRNSKTKEGIKKSKRKRMVEALGDKPNEALENLVKQGFSISEIAEFCKRSSSVVSDWLKDAGVKIEKSSALGKETLDYRETLVRLAKEAGLFKYLPDNPRGVMENLYATRRHLAVQDDNAGLNRSRQRISQLENRALKILEQMLRGELIPFAQVDEEGRVQNPVKFRKETRKSLPKKFRL